MLLIDGVISAIFKLVSFGLPINICKILIYSAKIQRSVVQKSNSCKHTIVQNSENGIICQHKVHVRPDVWDELLSLLQGAAVLSLHANMSFIWGIQTHFLDNEDVFTLKSREASCLLIVEFDKAFTRTLKKP